MDYFDFEKRTNVRVIEMKSLDAQFQIDMSTGSCKYAHLLATFNTIKGIKAYRELRLD